MRTGLAFITAGASAAWARCTGITVLYSAKLNLCAPSGNTGGGSKIVK